MVKLSIVEQVKMFSTLVINVVNNYGYGDVIKVLCINPDKIVMGDLVKAVVMVWENEGVCIDDLLEDIDMEIKDRANDVEGLNMGSVYTWTEQLIEGVMARVNNEVESVK